MAALRAASSAQDAHTVQHHQDLLWLRHQQTLAELDASDRENERLKRRVIQLETELDAEQPPTQVVNAMRSNGQALRPVRVTVDGATLIAGVQPTGRIDLPAEKRGWQRLQAQHRRTAQ